MQIYGNGIMENALSQEGECAVMELSGLDLMDLPNDESLTVELSKIDQSKLKGDDYNFMLGIANTLINYKVPLLLETRERFFNAFDEAQMDTIGYPSGCARRVHLKVFQRKLEGAKIIQ